MGGSDALEEMGRPGGGKRGGGGGGKGEGKVMFYDLLLSWRLLYGHSLLFGYTHIS